MKQIIQNLKTGDTQLEEVPVPIPIKGEVLIRTHKTLVSVGTEKMLVDFGKSNYINKIKKQPDKAKEVINKIKSDGLKSTVDAVFRKLEQPIPLGYCNAGEVIAIGEGVSEFRVGDRVASNGGHAEVVSVPENLVCHIPDNVTYDQATFTVIGAIGLQGIRLIKPSYGEVIVVSGLGLIGLISAQLLVANGCQVIGLDVDSHKVDLAKKLGIESYNIGETDVMQLVNHLTNSNGVDAVLITASTKSNNLISQAATISRTRGRIVLIGVIGLNINRSDFYKKELSFQVSCSYGPGRYNKNYENKGMDYPIGFVRWTQKRNFESVIKSISDQKISVDDLVTERVSINDYKKIYNNISSSSSIGSIIEFDCEKTDLSRKIKVHKKNFQRAKGIIGLIGAGNFTRSTVLPNFNKIGVDIKYICSAKGLSGTELAKKYNIPISVTDSNEILNDNTVDSIVITTKHNQHADLVIGALENNKNVFVEKPLALTHQELINIERAYNNTDASLTVGFNRRFSPFIIKAKNDIGYDGTPINVCITINAGHVAKDHWVQDMEVGGGRIIGEACHFIDLISFLTGSKVKSLVANALGRSPESNTDNVSIVINYENGSNGVVNYYSNGSKAYSKERVEIFFKGNTAIIDNFRKFSSFSKKVKQTKKLQDKGPEQIIDFDSIMNTSKSAIACIDSIITKKWIDVD